MRILDICSPAVETIDPDASARDAAERMRERHCGLLVVTSRNERRTPIGVVTDRDLVLKVMACGLSPEAVPVLDAMTREVARCAADDDLFTAARTMHRHGVRRLPVTGPGGEVIGLVSADDVHAALALHMRELSHAMVRGRIHELETTA